MKIIEYKSIFYNDSKILFSSPKYTANKATKKQKENTRNVDYKMGYKLKQAYGIRFVLLVLIQLQTIGYTNNRFSIKMPKENTPFVQIEHTMPK